MSEETSTVSNPQQLETGGWSENLQGPTKKNKRKIILTHFSNINAFQHCKIE
jgi:hypothetical protein